MSYFVTGATGFIGRYLVSNLLKRKGTVHVLVRKGSEKKLDADDVAGLTSALSSAAKSLNLGASQQAALMGVLTPITNKLLGK